MKKSIYKPAAFFRGILLPLAEEGCTLRQSMIIASILAKCSIPVHCSILLTLYFSRCITRQAVHSGVALLKLAEMPFSVSALEDVLVGVDAFAGPTGHDMSLHEDLAQ